MQRQEPINSYVLVSVVLDVYFDADPLGFPALITTATGRPLNRELGEVGEAAHPAIVTNLARAVATLRGLTTEKLDISQSYDPTSIVCAWQCDAEWHRNPADQAGTTSGLVRRGASYPASHDRVPSSACVLHRDLSPYDVLAEGDAFAAPVGWDSVGFSACQEDVGKALAGLLGMLAIAHKKRTSLASTLLHTYAQASSVPGDEPYRQSVPFALDTMLDWMVGGKSAPRDGFAPATEQIMNEGSTQQPDEREPGEDAVCGALNRSGSSEAFQ
jgi:hypothetical protein